MDRIKRRRRKAKGQKKLLLSTVDPWDVKVASLHPETLAARRGVSLSTEIVTIPNGGQSPSANLISTPSPWYKPDHRSPGPPTTERDDEALTSPEWPLPWYKPLRSPTADTFRDSTQSVPPLKPPRSRSNSQGPKSLVDKGIDRNLNQFVGSDGKDPVVQIHFENEEDQARRDGAVKSKSKSKDYKNVPEIVVSDTDGPGASNSDKNGVEEPEASQALQNGDHPLTIGKEETKNSIEYVVKDLVKARYSPQTARQRRLNRSSSRASSTHSDKVQIESDNKPSSEGTPPSLETVETPVVKTGPGNAVAFLEVSNNKNRTRKPSASVPDNLDNVNSMEPNLRNQGTSSRFHRNDSDSSTTFSNSGSTPRGSPLDSDTDDDVNDDELAKVPLQAPPRRKAATIVQISPGQKINKDSLEAPGVQSPNSTITSVNSISSLLKEKLQLSIPQALRSSKKQQNADYRLKAFVGILFLSIAFLVGFAHIYYNNNVLQRAYFDQFRFNKNDRVMHIYSKHGAEIIAAELGKDMMSEAGVFPCLSPNEKPDTECLEWLQQARLYMSHTQQDDMHCYHVTWQSLSPSYNPMDCFDWTKELRGNWYGAGQIQNIAYPLEKGYSVLEPSPFVTGDVRRNSFGNVLKRYFINSKGAAILIDSETPLYVSINANKSNELCLQAKHDTFAYINHLTPLPQLNYTVCASDSMKNLYSLVTEKKLWDGLKKEEMETVISLLSEPVWQIPLTNDEFISNYTQGVIDLGFLQGHVILNEEWQPNAGDFDLDETRLPTMVETVDMIQRRGFKVVSSIQPFISTESVNFKEAVASQLLISERGSDPRIPALTRYKNSNSAAMFDITNNRTIPWLHNKLKKLVEKYQVDSFYLDMGNAYDMPHYYKCQKPLANPDHYKTLFTEAIRGLQLPVIGVSGAITVPKPPVFVSLPPFPSSWKAIKTVIPTILSYGIIGYPFIMPGAVGGDVALPMSDNNPDNDFEVNLPDKELYVRWLQLSTFLPVIRFTHLPSKYFDESVLEIAKKLTTLRQKTVTPILVKHAEEALESGLPIIRPLWMLDPTDSACRNEVDEFSVGDELIVAPILRSGSRQREVYLPSGVWRDGIDGSLRKGSRWIHNYRVANDQVAYFVKIPDNTRF